MIQLKLFRQFYKELDTFMLLKTLIRKLILSYSSLTLPNFSDTHFFLYYITQSKQFIFKDSVISDWRLWVSFCLNCVYILYVLYASLLLYLLELSWWITKHVDEIVLNILHSKGRRLTLFCFKSFCWDWSWVVLT